MTGTSKCVDPANVSLQRRQFTDALKDGIKYDRWSAYVRSYETFGLDTYFKAPTLTLNRQY